MNIANLTIPITLVTFVVTFYTQNVWNKYWQAYTLTQHICGSIQDFTVLNSTFLARHDPATTWELTRYLSSGGLIWEPLVVASRELFGDAGW